MKRPFNIGKLITYHGRPWRVGMVGMISGERYYWLVRSGGEVAMVPAFMLEPR
jgi:hypothetical protein